MGQLLLRFIPLEKPLHADAPYPSHILSCGAACLCGREHWPMRRGTIAMTPRRASNHGTHAPLKRQAHFTRARGRLEPALSRPTASPQHKGLWAGNGRLHAYTDAAFLRVAATANRPKPWDFCKLGATMHAVCHQCAGLSPQGGGSTSATSVNSTKPSESGSGQSLMVHS